jgi:hypothetical protein
MYCKSGDAMHLSMPWENRCEQQSDAALDSRGMHGGMAQFDRLLQHGAAKLGWSVKDVHG